jgi:hypothetical protein
MRTNGSYSIWVYNFMNFSVKKILNYILTNYYVFSLHKLFLKNLRSSRECSNFQDVDRKFHLCSVHHQVGSKSTEHNEKGSLFILWMLSRTINPRETNWTTRFNDQTSSDLHRKNKHDRSQVVYMRSTERTKLFSLKL